MLIFVLSAAYSQKVGLVLSGGGARGLTHIGLIKALEENNIPIDYVAGTSMGAIVGGMYAKGLTTDEMIELIKSPDFYRWSSGKIPSDEKYYYYTADPRPIFFDLKFKVRNLLHLDSIDIRPYMALNMVDSWQMDLAFMELFAPEDAAAEYDFDKLFVPFRCVASDIYNEKPVVFSKGSLNDAVRASMTFPLMYKPIKVDGDLLFDGGIFNNFPVDVMRNDFAPDFIIGSVVAHNPPKPDKNNVLTQLFNMIMRKTDYDIRDCDGEVFKFNLEQYSLFNFSPVDKLVKTGYDSAMARMPELKSRIARQTDSAALAEKRQAFREKIPELIFQNIIITGVDSLQKTYIERLIHHKNDVFTLSEFRKKYFMILSEPKIREIIPHARYNPENRSFDLLLDVAVEEPVIIQVGGNISSSMYNEMYFAATYRRLSNYAFFINAETQIGNIYNMLALNLRVDFASRKPFYLNFTGVMHRFSFFEHSRWFYEDYEPADFDKQEVYFKVNTGFPVRMRGRFETGLGYGLLTDYYRLALPQSHSGASDDISRYSLGSFFLRYEDYTLNSKMYPTEGYRHEIGLQLVGGKETFKPGAAGESVPVNSDYWLQYRFYLDQYKLVSKKFTLGFYGELALSFREFSSNYLATMIQAPAFKPTPHSRTTFNQAYSALQFGALGVKPIFRLTDRLSFRTEAYWYLPFRRIVNDAGKARYEDFSLKASEFIAGATLVANLKPLSIGIFANRYSTAVNQWGIGLNIGFLLFDKPFLE